MMKNNLIIQTVMAIIAITVLLGCEPEPKSSDKNFSYKLLNKPLSKTTWDLTAKFQLFFDRGEEYITQVNPREIQILSVKNDSVIKKILLPKVRSIQALHTIDTGKIVVQTDSAFLVYNSGKFKEYLFKEMDKEGLPVGRAGIVYYPESNKLACEVVVYRKYLDKGKPKYDHKFLKIYDLSNNTWEFVDMNFPEIYHHSNLGIPRVCLTGKGQKLFVSLEFDINYYEVDIEHPEQVDMAEFSSVETRLDFKYPKDLSKDKRIDALIKQTNNYTGFGPVIYDDSSKIIYRVFRPFMPEKNHLGEYLTGKDKGCKILMKDEQGTIREYQLPNGVFFVPSNWKLNPSSGELTYPAIYRKNEQDENRYFQAYTFSPYYF